MNDSFFNLSEEKQLCIINAGFEVFSQNDYNHAITDDIAVKADISKGLLFYYFHNKRELYTYLIDYGEKQMRLQIQDEGFAQITDFFEMMKYGAQKKAEATRKNPYLTDFYIRAYFETDDAVAEKLSKLISVKENNLLYAKYFANINFDKFNSKDGFNIALEMLIYLAEGYLQSLKRSHKNYDPNDLMLQFDKWSLIIKKAVYKEEYI